MLVPVKGTGSRWCNDVRNVSARWWQCNACSCPALAQNAAIRTGAARRRLERSSIRNRRSMENIKRFAVLSNILTDRLLHGGSAAMLLPHASLPDAEGSIQLLGRKAGADWMDNVGNGPDDDDSGVANILALGLLTEDG